MPRRAFTLVELMVVIMVIAALAALAIPAIGFAKAKAKQVKSQTVLSQVQAALEKFKNTNGVYPEGPYVDPSVTPAPTTKPWSDFFGSGTTIKAADDKALDDTAWKTISHDLRGHLHGIDPENFSYASTDTTSANYYLRDAFAGPTDSEVLRYRPAKFYPFNNAATKLIDSDDPPGSDSYQLWSCGRDATDQQGEQGSDDLTSWTKRVKSN